MKVNGTATLHAPIEAVWKALNDPAILVRTIPGCQRLEEVGPDRYRMTVNAGVASIKGTYEGDVALTEQDPPGSFVLKASGAGGPGTVSADVSVTLAEVSEGLTRLEYAADAVVGGPVGGVGQRVLSGVAKKTAGEFFAAVDGVLTGASAPAPAGADGAAAAGTATAADTGSPAAGGGAAPTQRRVFAAPQPPRRAVQVEVQNNLAAVAVGALVALAGVVVGWRLARGERVESP